MTLIKRMLTNRTKLFIKLLDFTRFLRISFIRFVKFVNIRSLRVLRRHRKQYWAYVGLASITLNLLLPLAGLIQPVQANNLIKPTQKGPALFENQSPGFTAEFGDREKPEEHRLRFESKPELATKGPTFYGYEQEEVSIGQRAKEAVLGAESKGVELRLVEIGQQKATSSEVALSGAVDSRPTDTVTRLTENKSVVNSGGEPENRTLSPKGRTGYRSGSATMPIDSPPSTILPEKLEKVSQELEEVKGKLEEIGEQVTSVSKDVTEVTKVTKNILEESGVGKPELSVRPSMEETPEDFARTADPQSAPPSAYSLPIDTVSQTIDETTKVEYQVIVGRGVKESITLLESTQEKQDSNGKTQDGVLTQFTFELKLDPGVEVRQTIDGLKDAILDTKGSQGSHPSTTDNSGVIYFVDRFGRYLFHFQTPYMIDAAGAKSSAVSLGLQSTQEKQELNGTTQEKIPAFSSNIPASSGVLYLKVTADQNWLMDSARVYPILIDPTIVHENNPAFSSGTENRSQTTTIYKGVSGATYTLDTTGITEAVQPVSAVTSQYKELQPDINTVGLWHFNEGTSTTAYDASGNANTGTLTNGPVWNGPTDTQVGLGKSSMKFNGNGDYVQMATSSSLNLSLPYSIEFWMKANDSAAFDSIISRTPTVGSAWNYLITSNDTAGGELRLATGAAGYNMTSPDVTDGKWHHVAVTIDAAGVLQWYVDGQARDRYTGVSTSTGTSVTCLGVYQTNSTTCSNSYQFSGSLDEVHISNIARTPEEIAASASRYPYAVHESPVIDFGSTPNTLDSLNYSATGVQTGDGEKPFSSDGLVAQWNFNETSGTAAYNTAGSDSCGGTPSSCNGTLTTFASTASQDEAAGTGWTANNKRWGAGALMFDGTNDNVAAGTDSSLNILGDLSIEAWVKTSITPAAATYPRIFSREGSGSPWNGYDLAMYDTGVLAFYNNTISWNTGTKKINDGQWHHVAMTANNKVGSLYVDGILDKTFVYSAPTTISTTAYVGGYANSAHFWNGSLDAVKVYNRALSSTEVLSNAQSANIEFQTRTGATSTPNDGTWETWKTTFGTGDTQISANDSGQYDTTDANMVSYWKLDGNATDSKDSNNGTITEAAATGNGRFGSGYSFDGTNDVITVTQAANINLTSKTAYTMEAWFKADTDGEADVGQIVQKGAATFIRVDTQGTDNTLDVEASFDLATTDATLNITDATHTSNWTHLALVYEDDADDEITLYINGVNMGSSTNGVGSPATESNDLLIGGTTTANFDGVIDEVAIWNDARSAAEVAQDAYWAPDLINNAAVGGITTSQDTATKIEGTGSEKLSIGSPQVDANTVGLWHMEETSGTGAYIQDSTANNNDGTPTGTTVVDGFYGKARSLDGVDDVISFADSENWNFGTGNFALEGWFKSAGAATRRTILGQIDGGAWSNIGWVITMEADNTLMFQASHLGGAGVTLTTTATYGDSKWHNVSVTRTTNDFYLYVDGAQQATTNNNITVQNHTTTVKLGTGYNSNYFNGSVDEVRITKGATRTAEEIAEGYRAGRDHRLSKTISSTDLSAKTKLPFYVASDRPGTFLEATVGESSLLNMFGGDTDMKGYWPLDENSTGAAAVTRNDYSGNGNNLTDNATVTSNQGKIGKAGQFTAANSEYLSIADNASLSTGDIDFSMAAWVYLDSAPSGDSAILAQGHADVSDFAYMLYATSNSKLNLLVGNGTSEASVASDITLSTGTFYFVVAWHDATANTVNIQVNNGTVASTSYSSGSFDSGDIFVIGRKGADANGYWNGRIDNVMFLKRVLTADERRQMFEIGKRTHPITIDFKSQLDASGLITGSGDYTFSLSSDYEYVSQNLAIGEKIIVRENVGGTEYIAQGTVSAVTYGAGVSNANAPNQALTNATSTVVTVTSWDGGSTFPTGGFTLMAAVFKWQREFMDLTPISLTSQRDAVTRITLRVTDGSQGATIWLDDFESADYSGGAMTGSNSASIAIGSTAARYFQYRAILTTRAFTPLDAQLSNGATPTLTSVQINYNSGTTPQTPKTKDASSDFATTGSTLNRVVDSGSGSSPQLELAYKEMSTDINTATLLHMNENAVNTCSGGVNDVCDSSGNSFNGAFNGNAAFTTTSKFGASAVTFDGTGDYISFGDKADFNQQSFTLEAWFKTTSSSTQTLIAKQNETGGDRHYRLTMTGGTTPTLETYTGTVTIVCNLSGVAGNYNDGNWHHIGVVSIDSSAGTECSIYMDGAFNSRTTSTNRIDSSGADLRIGDMESPAAGWNGQIDEVRISNIARTPEEIKYDAGRRPYGVYTSDVQNLGTQVSSIDNLRWTENGVQTGDGETPSTSSGLVAQWNFNETSGTTAANNAGTGSCGGTPSSCNGTLTTFASTASQDQAAGTGWTSANRRWGAGALMFDGTDDEVGVGNNASLSFGTSTNFSISSWINTSGTGAEYQIYGGGAPGGDGSVVLRLVSGAAKFNVGAAAVQGTKDLRDGKWHFITAVADRSTNLKIYVDGILENTTTGATTSNNATAATYYIGRTTETTSRYKGIIDSVQIYSRALTATEILSNYQAGNVELQTRTGTTTTPNDGTWEDWKPTTNETALDSSDSLSPVEKISQTSLTAYWKLDETSGSRADSKGTNTLTDNNTVTYAPGRLSNAGQFTSANNEYLSITDNTDMSSGDVDFTWSGWMYLDTKSSYRYMFQKGTTVSATGREYAIYYDSSVDRFVFQVFNNASAASATANTLGSPSTATWYQIIGWHDATANTVNIQVNGGAVDSTSYSSGVADGTESLIIGARSSADNNHDGKIDELAFWKRTLTAAERTRLFEDGLDLHGAGSGRIYRSADTTTKFEGSGSEKLTIGAPQVDSSTAALWHMDETSGTGAYIQDATANNNDGTPTGTTVVDGFYGKGRSFNGSSDYIGASDSIFPSGSSARTIEARIKTSMSTEGYFFTYGTCSGTNTVGFGTLNGKLMFTQNGASIQSTANINDGKWHSVAMTQTGSTQKMYIDGIQDGSGSMTVNTVLNATNIGRSICAAGYFNGQIDEIKVSNVVISDDEIAEGYRAGRDHRLTKSFGSAQDLSAKTKLPFYVASDRPGTFLEATIGESSLLNNFAGDPDLKGYWPLDENSTGGAAVTRNDYSGNGNNLTDNATVTSTQGKIGKAGQFTAANSEYLSIADNAALSTGNIDFTVSAWVYLDSKSALMEAMGKFGASGNREWDIGYSSASDKFYVAYDQSGNQLLASTTPISTATWYFIVAWHNSSDNSMHISVNNGTTADQTTGVSVVDGTAAFNIGRTQDANGYWNGKIDEVMFLKRVLTADERRQMFEIGKRTHAITNDFVTTPQATYSSGTSVTINNPYGTTNLTDTLSIGETMIFKENVGGTETVSQAVVTNIVNTSSVYGTVTLLAAPSFPSGGYTTNATVFKWQREFWDITGSLPSQRDGSTRLTMRITDGSAGANVWIDDIKSAGPYLSVGSARTSTIASTPQQYFQYRVIFSTTDTAVTPSVTSVSLQYHSDPQKVTGSDTFASGTYDNDGNVQLGSNNVKDVQFYDRTKDQISYALETDGSNDYVDIGTGPTSVKTVEFWVYPETTTEYFINLTSTTDYIWVNAGTITATGFASPTIYVNGNASTTLSADQWSHVVVTDTTGENASNFDIGRTQDTNYLEGKIDEVALFSDVRTATEVVNDYNARRLAGTEDALVAVYHFDEGSGTRAADPTGNFHGTLTNMTDDDWVNSLSDKDQSALSQQVLGVDPNWANGPARQSYAWKGDGSGDYVDMGDKTEWDFGNADFTLEAWVKKAENGRQQMIIGKDDNGVGTRQFTFHFNSSDLLRFFYFKSGDTLVDSYTTTATITDTNWHHVVGQRESDAFKIYIDGVSQALTTSGTHGAMQATTAVLQIGARSASANENYFNGQIDEVRISNIARYSSNFTPSRRFVEDANTAGLWHFDEGEDNTCSGGTNDVCDADTSGNDGANNGNPTWTTDARAVMDNNARYVSLGASSAVNTDRGMELKITSTTAFQYRWQGDQTWTTPATSTLSSYSFTSPSQIDSTGVYVGFDTTNGTFGDESYFLIPSWALEQFSNSDTQNAMRGTKRGFPERTYLVATDKGVDILDADTNNLWMRVENGSGRSLGTFTNNTPSSVFMAHGSLFVGTNGTAATGLYRYDFNRDKIYRYNATNRTTNTVNIAKRNTADSSYGSADTGQNLISSVVNDAHALTIQGKLLLAAATDTGVTKISNIMSSDTSYDYSDNASDDYGHVVLAETASGQGDVYADNDTTDALERWNNVLDDAASETAGTPDTTYDEASTPAIFTSAQEINDLAVISSSNYPLISSNSPVNILYLAHNGGATALVDNRSAPTDSHVKYFTKDYISEELIGDTRGMWPLNGLSDASVKAQTLTNNGSVTFTTSGVRGLASTLNGSSQYLSVGDNANFSITGALTIGAWIYPTSLAGDKVIISKWGTSQQSYILYIPSSTNKLNFLISSNGGAITTAAGNTALQTNRWYYVSAAYTPSSKMEVFVNGISDGSNSTSIPASIFDSTAGFSIGWDTPNGLASEYFAGVIDEPFVTAETLTATQISQMYVSGREALNNKYRAKLASDTLNELAGDDNTVKAVAASKLNQTGVTRGEYLYVGTNGASADDGSLSRILVNGDIRDATYDEANTEPYVVTDNDINSLSVSSDGAYIIVGSDDSGVTIIQSGSSATRMRGGKKTQGGMKRPHN